MANILDRYGIKEVADVTLYSIELDENDDERYIPVLYHKLTRCGNTSARDRGNCILQ